MTLSVRKYRAAILRASEPYHATVRGSWHLVDDDERHKLVTAAHREAVDRLSKLREQYDSAVAGERAKLVRQAFTPWHDRPADRSAFEAHVAELAARINDESAAYRELTDARSRAHERPHDPLAVLRVAWERGWLDVVALGRTGPADVRHWGRNSIDALLDFEAEVAECGPAAFDLAPVMTELPA